MPFFNIALTPVFNDEGRGDYIEIYMTWDSDAKSKGDVLFHHLLNRSGVPTAQYTVDVVEVRQIDSEKPLKLYTEDNKLRNFRTGHDIPAGKLTARYRVSPRHTDEYTKCGPQIAVEREDSGMSGGGMAFILRPAGDEIFDFSIDWDLSSAPPGTRGVCSLGEGKVTAKVKAAVLDECFFEVGAVKSYPANAVDSPFGLYWLDEPTFDVPSIGRELEVVVPQTMAFFHDQDPSFRVFIRRNVYKCNSGRGLYRGFVFAWNHIVPRDRDGTLEFLFHEIVHNWPRLDFYTGGPEDLADGWYNEGIAEYYSLILPLRSGIFSEGEFVKKLNDRIQGYYTNPDRAILNKDVPAGFWKPGHVNRIPYQRGLMYFLRLAHQLHRAKKRSLDDLILEMLRLRLANEPYHIKVWLSMIEAELGPHALKDYQDMSDAKLIVLSEDCLEVVLEGSKARWAFQREDQEEFYLGFPEECLTNSPRIVKALDMQSRAAEAGVCEGDEISQKYSYLYNAEKWNETFRMTVKREQDGLLEVSWWPRTWEKVESYRFVSK
ncbi:hypothetical protein MMC10_010381 [Thelotrema lepadinum]|nr:hypothetical protein [Thelotrema lepadinum]